MSPPDKLELSPEGVVIDDFQIDETDLLHMQATEPTSTQSATTHLFDSAQSVGLVHIENRNTDINRLPPRTYFGLAKAEVVISGMSCHRTFRELLPELIEIVSSGRHLFVLILDPITLSSSTSVDLGRIFANEYLDIVKEIYQVFSIIEDNNLHKNKHFHLRLFKSVPAFTAVMLDGDVEELSQLDQITSGIIRVQPGREYKSQHQGLVLQLEDRPQGAYQFFAADLREQWDKASEWTHWRK